MIATVTTIDWPAQPQRFADVLAAVREGFGLLMVPNKITDRAQFTYSRCGLRAPYWIREDLAIAVQRSQCLGHGMAVGDGSFLYMQTTRC